MCVSEFVAFAGTDPRAYSPGLVEDWLTALQKGRAPQTANVYRKAIRYASKRWAKYQSPTDPRVDFALNADPAKAQPGAQRVPLTVEEAAQLIATCDQNELIDIRDRALIVMALRSGLRRGGLAALQFSGIQGSKITTINKGGRDITFEADAETLSTLNAWLGALRVAGITTGRVFRGVRGNAVISKPMTPFQIWYVFSGRAKRAGIRHVFPHLARHSTVTWLREAGLSAAQVSTLTGQSERTIENIYTHVRTKGAVSAALPPLIKPAIDPKSTGRKPK
jgi:integrase